MTENQEKVNLTIDGREVAVPKGTTVYHAATSMGIDLPIFCYQDRMPPFGACRVCLVEVEKTPKLQTSCTLVATDGMVVKTNSQMAIDGRNGILEFLLINHPLDCPICDRGGECPLQDQTFKFGPGQSRFFEDKRRFKKPIPLGPVLMLDRERCIVCARCTRFGEHVAGDHALEFIDRGYKTEVGTPDGKPVDSKFIGNTIMICPVGALTSQVYRFRARPWDNDSTPSSCTLCPVGCSLIIDSRDGEIMRTRSDENSQVNDIWLCDKGWFGYEFTSNEARLKTPLCRKDGELVPISWESAFQMLATIGKEALGQEKIAGWGGNPLTVEENHLFQKLMREVFKVDNVDHRIGMVGAEDQSSGLEITIGECQELSFAFLLGADLTEEFPVIWLRLKEGMNRGAKVIFGGYYAPEIANTLTETIIHPPGKDKEFFEQISEKIKEKASAGQKGAIFVGSQYLKGKNRLPILSFLLALKNSYPQLSLNLLEGRGNSFGAEFAGMRPSEKGLNALSVLQEGAKGGWNLLYVAGANPAKKYPLELWNEFRKNLKFLVVQDLFLTDTAKEADLVLPTLAYVEKGGSFINVEGRVQSLLPGKVIPENLLSDGDIFVKFSEILGKKINPDQNFLNDLEKGKITFKKLDVKNNNWEGYTDGMKAVFSHKLFDNGVRMKFNPHVIQLAKTPYIRIHPEEGLKRDLIEGDQVKVTCKGKSIQGIVRWDKKVAADIAVLPLGFDELPCQNLADKLINGLEIELEKLEQGESHAS